MSTKPKTKKFILVEVDVIDETETPDRLEDVMAGIDSIMESFFGGSTINVYDTAGLKAVVATMPGFTQKEW